MYDFQDYLKEGDSYVIHKFRVKYVKEEIKKTDLHVLMVFTYKTWVEHSPNPIESKIFSMKSFKNILDGKVHSNYLYGM